MTTRSHSSETRRPSGLVQPVYSTGVGLMPFGDRRHDKKTYSDHGRHARVGVKGVIGKMRSWFQGNF